MTTIQNHSKKADQGIYLDRLHATFALDNPVSSVKQISEARARVLYRSFGVKTIRDLLSLYPHRYIDMSQVVSVQQAEIGKQYTIFGTIYEMKQKRP